MSCRSCVYLSHTGSHTGMCTRHTVHTKVDKTHFCGEYVGKIGTNYRLDIKTSYTEDTHQQLIETYVEVRRLQRQNRELKAQGKNLRELYKADTGKVARVKKV